MTLDEAIKHAEEVAEEKRCEKCGEEHRQLSEWLKELKQLRKQEKTGHWIDHSDEGYVECSNCGSATNCDGNIADLHFCFSCGAVMEDKDLICKELAKLLKLTRNQSDLKALRYEILDNNEEIVTVEWESGGRKVVGVSMDSGTAMIRDIMRAID